MTVTLETFARVRRLGVDAVLGCYPATVEHTRGEKSAREHGVLGNKAVNTKHWNAARSRPFVTLDHAQVLSERHNPF